MNLSLPDDENNLESFILGRDYSRFVQVITTVIIMIEFRIHIVPRLEAQKILRCSVFETILEAIFK